MVLVLGSAGAEVRAGEKVYEPYKHIVRGTEGVEPVAITVRNASGTAVVCTASLAHWYSAPLGEMEARVSLGFTLWHDPASGELSLLNALEDRMPVEAIWCGHADRLDETRTRLALEFAAGDAPEARSYACADRPDGRLDCGVD